MVSLGGLENGGHGIDGRREGRVAQSDASWHWNGFTHFVFSLTLAWLYAWEASLASAAACARVPRACCDQEWPSRGPQAPCPGTGEVDSAEEDEVGIVEISRFFDVG